MDDDRLAGCDYCLKQLIVLLSTEQIWRILNLRRRRKQVKIRSDSKALQDLFALDLAVGVGHDLALDKRDNFIHLIHVNRVCADPSDFGTQLVMLHPIITLAVNELERGTESLERFSIET
ncbi:hypothetical protein CVO96_20495 [Deinococcus koreensis]|uniref:Uncharacterized protein n=1 Tax=Deinococcus koreensis TaxID=2054903 RepID=A0A2K3URL3_9DEIO|nr:hypothetical protein CVO96_20495 [Deinococcus koreensis]